MSVLPTMEGLLSKVSPTDVSCTRTQRMSHSKSYLDWQLWLLQQDLALWTRDEIQRFTKEDQSIRRGLCLENLTMEGPHSSGRHPWALQFLCLEDFPPLRHRNEAERRFFLQENKKFLKHESSVCLIVDGEPRWFGYLIREEEYLCLSPPVLSIRLLDTEVDQASLILRTAKQISLLQLNTALFAYEPVLNALSGMSEIPLKESLLHWTAGSIAPRIDYMLTKEISDLMANLEENSSLDLKETLRLSSEVRLDPSQATCFMAGLSQSVALIQGPPGTGKSFIGSLIAKAILEHSDERILLVCQTHHALDQFLADCLQLGIAPSKIVRMGSTKKAIQATQSLSLNSARSKRRFSPSQQSAMAKHKAAIASTTGNLRDAFNNIAGQKFSKVEIMNHIKTLKGELPFYDAFNPPPPAGKPKKLVHEFYLLDRWFTGRDCGVLRAHGHRFPSVWQLNAGKRKEIFSIWEHEIMMKRSAMLQKAGNEHDFHVARLNAMYRDKDINILRQKRMIACTTTAAAKYMLTIQAAAPTVVFVEEAGQILESHILTALGPRTKQLVMIGDHKQLRPRAHYNLSVEKGAGFDLNRSLFERLILAGYPHQVLSQQHRMRPEIAALVRELSYPGLTDAPRTLGRKHLRGLQNDVIFLSHSKPESELGHAHEWRDFESTKSKRNLFEARMVVKCVQYLTQQGYSTESIAVLTPYLGQLRLLMEELQQHSNPQLSELDSQDLVRAGLAPPYLERTGKPHIRVSTIDNFQGDESDIVIASLTRSNTRRDIGFMAARERLNVLLSRARDGLILVGDAETFRESRAKGSPWSHFMDDLAARGHLYQGLPTRCERHKTRETLLRSPEKFEKKCPGGGCRQPCTTLLSCGVHSCPRTCHEPCDHSKISCEVYISWICEDGHRESRKCHSRGQPCGQCRPEDLRRQAFTDKSDSLSDVRLNSALSELSVLLKEKYKGSVRIEDGTEGLAARVFCRRVARSCGKVDRVKMRVALETAWAGVSKRKAARSSLDSNTLVHEEHFCAEDLLGPEPREYLKTSGAWESVQDLIGVQKVKDSMADLIDLLQLRYELDLKEKPPISITLNRLFVGKHGTGKTTMCWLYAAILSDLGVLRSSDVVFKHPDDLIGDSIQESEQITEAVLRNARGKVLAIRDAFGLREHADSAEKACRFAILQKLLAAAGDELLNPVCLILLFDSSSRALGTFNSLRKTGVASYFPLDAAFCFDTPGEEELRLLLETMLRKRRLSATMVAKEAALNRLCKARAPRFGNARAVETLIDIASERARLRRLSASAETKQAGNDVLLDEEDFCDHGCE